MRCTARLPDPGDRRRGSVGFPRLRGRGAAQRRGLKIYVTAKNQIGAYIEYRIGRGARLHQDPAMPGAGLEEAQDLRMSVTSRGRVGIAVSGRRAGVRRGLRGAQGDGREHASAAARADAAGAAHDDRARLGSWRCPLRRCRRCDDPRVRRLPLRARPAPSAPRTAPELDASAGSRPCALDASCSAQRRGGGGGRMVVAVP